MIDRDGRIVLGGLLLFVLVLTGSLIADAQFGVSLRDYPLLSVLVFAGVAVVAPQLYLAATDDEIPSRVRIQFAAVATAVFAVAFAGNAEGVRYLLIAAIGACSVLVLVCYELLVGYRASGDESTPRIQ